MPDLMLSTRGSPDDVKLLQDKGYLFDMKIDGVRCLAVIESGQVALTSRTGIDITKCYPEIVAALKDTCPSDIVLDGEISIFDERGLPSWPKTHLRAAKQSRFEHWSEALPAHLMVFDILRLGHQDLRPWAYANRRQVLEQEVKDPSGVIVPTVLSADGEKMWELVREYDLEGLIAKRPDAPYRLGRSRDWVKIKRTNTVSCLVGGFDPGEGSRSATFGCLHLYLLDDAQTLVQVGKVGSGFSDRELKRVMQAMHSPPLIVEVEYLDVSPDGQLRQPVFQRMRDDLAVTDCTMNQLKEASS